MVISVRWKRRARTDPVERAGTGIPGQQPYRTVSTPTASSCPSRLTGPVVPRQHRWKAKAHPRAAVGRANQCPPATPQQNRSIRLALSSRLLKCGRFLLPAASEAGSIAVRTSGLSTEMKGLTGKHAPITIGDDCWIATDALVLPGVTVERGAVVGARSMVMDSLPRWSIVVGQPARVLGERGLKGESRNDYRKT